MKKGWTYMVNPSSRVIPLGDGMGELACLQRGGVEHDLAGVTHAIPVLQDLAGARAQPMRGPYFS